MEENQFVLSQDLSPRLAAIDIGTNSIRLIIAEPLRDGRYRILDEEKETTRLGRALAATGRLDPEAVEQSLVALRQMKQIAAGFQVSELRTIGTCALREAEDGPEFIARARDEIGLSIEVITGQQEAHLAYLSVAGAFNLNGVSAAVADIGGGSTEVILATSNVVEAEFTTPLGAVRMTELYGAANEMTNDAFQTMLDGIEAELKKRIKKKVGDDRNDILRPHMLIGSGGTFTTLAEIIMASKSQTGLPLRGYEINRAQVRHLLDRLRKLNAKARRALPGLSADRADIIVAGVAIIDRLMKVFKVNRLQIHDRGVRDGLLLTMMDGMQGISTPDPQDIDSAIDRFAASCGVDIKHGRQVGRLAGSIFAQLAPTYGLEIGDRVLLETAARLQDVGYMIDYDKHHKHSYHLILHSRLPGFQPRELEVIANIARYHRGSTPKKKHTHFMQLPAADQTRVRQLASILRLAGGFDRSHSQQVQDIAVEACGASIVMRAVAVDFPEVDLWGARRRMEPFEKAFDVTLEIDWVSVKELQTASSSDTTPVGQASA